MKLPPDVLEFFRRTGKIGVQKRNAGLSAARRSEIARIAANVRWNNVATDPSQEKQSRKQGAKPRAQNKTGKRK